jgi:hypothetical protein
MSKCGKCGEDGHNARSCGRAPKHKGSKKGKPKSWIKSLEKKLAAVGEQDEELLSIASRDSAEVPPQRKGEPFADLPPLDMPNAPSSDAETAEGSPTSETATPDTPTDSKETTSSTSSGTSTEKKIFDTAQLEMMAEQAAFGATMALGKFAAERNYFALGEPFAKLAGIAAGVLIKVHAVKVGISDEEAAAWVCFGIVGFNGVQAGRAAYKEMKRKEEEKKRERASAVGRVEQQRQANGVTPEHIAEQRERDAEHVEQFKTQGAVV